jgi:pimeloyl-ACP methyl ester carboxylesterase
MRMTRQLLYTAGISLLLVGCSHLSKVAKVPVSAVSSTAKLLDLSKHPGSGQTQPLARLGQYLDDADTARKKLGADPSDTDAQSDYNFAISRITEIIEDADLAPWDKPLSCDSQKGQPWSFSLRSPDPRPEYHPSNFHFHPSDRYRFGGKLIAKRVLKEGLGAPVIVSSKDLDFTKYDPFAQGKKVYYGFTAMIYFKGRQAELVVFDPLDTEQVSYEGHNFPLAADFQGPLALSMVESHPKKEGRNLMFQPTKQENTGRLSRLQVYNPNKIPVIFIHGLGDSQATWTPMINYLRLDSTIRDRYQFWVFSYPTGLPYPIPAATLRHQLDLMGERYPNHKDIVIVAHSLGGNLSRLLISDSGMKIWDTYFDKPPEKIPFHDKTRAILSQMLIFKARPDVSRVIFASASLGGSEKATNFWGRLGAKMIGDPMEISEVNKEAISHARPEFREGRSHLPNSVEILDPGTTFLGVVNGLPIKPSIPYHTIIGDRGKGGNLDHSKPASTDGIVPYWSSHLDGAKSETIIPSGHWSIRHPDGMAEVKRILLQHKE